MVGVSTTMALPASGGMTTSIGLGGVVMSGFRPGASTGPEVFE